MDAAAISNPQPAKSAGSHPTDPGICVLVVEDDDADAYLIERALSSNNAIGKIVRATDGLKAFDLVESGAVRPDVALVDLHMPKKDGFQLLAEFGARPEPRFPIVVLTSSLARADAMRSRLRVAARVVTKPTSVEELEEVLAVAVTSACTGVTLAPVKRAKPPPRAGSQLHGAPDGC